MSLEIDGIEYDPYYVLGVAQTDDLDHISKAYRKKAKKYHPDKCTKDNKDRYKIIFKMLTDSYTYIKEKREQQSHSSFKRKFKEERDRETIVKTDINNVVPLFEKMSLSVDNTKRMTSLDEYESTIPKIKKLLDKKEFDLETFNEIFEYNNEKHLVETGVHVSQSSDGFAALDIQQGNCAGVYSYKGLLLAADNSIDVSEQQHYKNYFSNVQNPETLTKTKKKPLNLPKRSISNLESERNNTRFEYDNGTTLDDHIIQELEQKEARDLEFIQKYTHRIYSDRNTAERMVKNAINDEIYDRSGSYLDVLTKNRLLK